MLPLPVPGQTSGLLSLRPKLAEMMSRTAYSGHSKVAEPSQTCSWPVSQKEKIYTSKVHFGFAVEMLMSLNSTNRGLFLIL